MPGRPLEGERRRVAGQVCHLLRVTRPGGTFRVAGGVRSSRTDPGTIRVQTSGLPSPGRRRRAWVYVLPHQGRAIEEVAHVGDLVVGESGRPSVGLPGGVMRPAPNRGDSAIPALTGL